MDLKKQIKEINDKIEELDKKIEETEKNRKEREEETKLGLISIRNGYIHLELLLDNELFNEKQLEQLKDIANKLQLVMLEVQEKIGEDK